MKKNVLLVAVGGIGFRHFQAILNCEEEIALYVVDLSDEALSRAHQYADTLEKKPEVFYSKDIQSVPKHIDVAIIATPSLPRRAVFENLVSTHIVDNIIFEKFLFPSLYDYDAVEKILTQKGIRAHVDCPATMYEVYHQIREESKDYKFFNAVIKGSNWGLACNSIHFVDQIAFLACADTKDFVCTEYLEDEIFDSKREGYIEFFGKIVGNFGDKVSFVIECDHRDNPLEFEFFTDKAYYYVNEVSGIMTKIYNDKPNSRVTSSIKIPYVSQLTNINVDRLLRRQDIDLVSFDESRPLHEGLLKMFLFKMEQVNKHKTDSCPIT